MSPVLDWEPGQNPAAEGTLNFYVEGRDPSTGLRIMTDGRMLAPGNDALAWPTSEPAPPDHGMESWVYPPALCTGGSAAVNGTRYLTKLYTRRARTSVAVHWAVTTAGASPVAGQNWVGIYSSAGVRLGQAGVDADISSSGAKRTVIAAAYDAGFVWVAWVFNAATPPTLARAGSFETTPNAGLTAAALQFAVNGTSQTTLASSLTPGSNSTSGALNWWAGLE
jgi:hypothetical protein